MSSLRSGGLERLSETDPAALYWHIHPDMNSIGVTIWHVARWFDLFGEVFLIGGGRRDAQLWFREGWAQRTGYDPRGLGYGRLGLLTGYAPELMRAVPRLDASELAAYFAMSSDSILSAIARLTDEALAEVVEFEGEREVLETTTRYDHIVQLGLGATRHLGEIDALNRWHRALTDSPARQRTTGPHR